MPSGRRKVKWLACRDAFHRRRKCCQPLRPAHFGGHRDAVRSGKVSTRAKVFICYARQDAGLCKELRAHLSSVQWSQDPTYEVWYDGAIDTGNDWPDDLHQQLQQADIFIVLLSKWLLASKFVRDTEFKVIEQRRARQACTVLVVPTAEVALTHTPFARIQAVLPKPITAYARHDDAWPMVCHAVEAAAATYVHKGSDPSRKQAKQSLPADDEALAPIIPIRRARPASKATTATNDAVDLRSTFKALPLLSDPGWASFNLRAARTRSQLQQALRGNALSPWMYEQALILSAALDRLCQPSTDAHGRTKALGDARRAVQELTGGTAP